MTKRVYSRMVNDLTDAEALKEAARLNALNTGVSYFVSLSSKGVEIQGVISADALYKHSCHDAVVNELFEAIQRCLPDLEHYARTHGSGPDVRVATLKARLAALGKYVPAI